MPDPFTGTVRLAVAAVGAWVPTVIRIVPGWDAPVPLTATTENVSAPE